MGDRVGKPLGDDESHSKKEVHRWYERENHRKQPKTTRFPHMPNLGLPVRIRLRVNIRVAARHLSG